MTNKLNLEAPVFRVGVQVMVMILDHKTPITFPELKSKCLTGLKDSRDNSIKRTLDRLVTEGYLSRVKSSTKYKVGTREIHLFQWSLTPSGVAKLEQKLSELVPKVKKKRKSRAMVGTPKVPTKDIPERELDAGWNYRVPTDLLLGASIDV